MKKFLFVLSVVLFTSVPMIANATATKLPLSYRAVYCYPTGSYWVNQIATYPDYYTAHNASFVTRYGAATKYCPAN